MCENIILPESFYSYESPAMCFHSGGLCLNRAFIVAARKEAEVNGPCWVQLLVRPADALVAAIRCGRKAKWAVKCADEEGLPVGAEGRAFVAHIYEMMGWRKNRAYVVVGHIRETENHRNALLMKLGDAVDAAEFCGEEIADLSQYEVVPKRMFARRRAQA